MSNNLNNGTSNIDLGSAGTMDMTTDPDFVNGMGIDTVPEKR